MSDYYITCALCNDAKAVWSENKDWRKKLQDHAEERHRGNIKYEVLEENDL